MSPSALVGWAAMHCLSVRRIGRALLDAGHHSLAVVGLVVVALLAFALGEDGLRHRFEVGALQWLQDRHDDASSEDDAAAAVVAAPAPDAAVPVAATSTKSAALPGPQATLARWIARRYRVAPEPIEALVREAWQVGQRTRLDPTLILAIVAIESRFNPYAQSSAGAQGLMQVMTRVHRDKYQAFGGTHAAFDPISNLRVGVQVLEECIARAGGLNAGLRYYVGAALMETDGGYAARVLREQAHMRSVVEGRRVALNASNSPPPQPRAEPVPTVDAALPAVPADAPASAAPLDAVVPQQVAAADVS